MDPLSSTQFLYDFAQHRLAKKEETKTTLRAIISALYPLLPHPDFDCQLYSCLLVIGNQQVFGTVQCRDTWKPSQGEKIHIVWYENEKNPFPSIEPL